MGTKAVEGEHRAGKHRVGLILTGLGKTRPDPIRYLLYTPEEITALIRSSEIAIGSITPKEESVGKRAERLYVWRWRGFCWALLAAIAAQGLVSYGK